MRSRAKKITAFVTGLFLSVTSVVSASGQTLFVSGSAEGGATVDKTIVQTYTPAEINVKNPPAVVCDVTDKMVLDGLKSAIETDGARPSNAILRFNEQAKIVGKNGEELGNFQTVFQDVLKGKVIPVLSVQTEQEADALIAFLNDKIDILDMAVMSDTPALVKKVRETKTAIRGIVSFTAETELSEIVKTANIHLANTVVLPASMGTAENVRYLQNRWQTVWLATDSVEKIQINDCIQSGAFGIIATDYNAVFSMYETYGESLCRTPINIARRGVTKLHNENSRLGTEKAIAYGADAVELDVHLTKDNAIVFMDDATLNRTTDGTGYLNSYTLKELQEFNLDLIEGEEETIPTIDDILPLFAQTDAVCVLDIRSGAGTIVPLIREKLIEYEMLEQVVCISTNQTLIQEARTFIPEIATVSFAFTELRAAYEASDKTAYDKAAFESARGLVSYSSNLSYGNFMDEQTQKGTGWLMTDDASYYRNREQVVSGKNVAKRALELGDKIELSAVNYNGSVENKTGEVFYLEDKGTYWQVIASYTGKLGISLYTQSFKVEKVTGEDLPTDSSSSASNDSANSSDSATTSNGAQETPKSKVGVIVLLSVSAVVVLAVGAFFLFRKKK
ncbi:MAG: hypothetical protein IJW60_05775 [Clostridia bacterium]|nr:hypothetical protein [Clostridia bacterium]